MRLASIARVAVMSGLFYASIQDGVDCDMLVQAAPKSFEGYDTDELAKLGQDFGYQLEVTRCPDPRTPNVVLVNQGVDSRFFHRVRNQGALVQTGGSIDDIERLRRESDFTRQIYVTGDFNEFGELESGLLKFGYCYVTLF